MIGEERGGVMVRRERMGMGMRALLLWKGKRGGVIFLTSVKLLPICACMNREVRAFSTIILY